MENKKNLLDQSNDKLLTDALNKIDILRRDIMNVCPPKWALDVITLDKNKQIKYFEKIIEEVDSIKEIIGVVRKNTFSY